MSNTSSTSNKVNVPEARAALEQFKYEVANEIGVPLKKGYNGDLTSCTERLCRRLYGKENDRSTGKNDG